jgi:hypothetical protein
LPQNLATARARQYGSRGTCSSSHPLPFSLSIYVLTSIRWIWNPDRYVAIKIHASIPNLKGADNELAIAKHIWQTESSHHGRRFVRGLLDSFKLEGTANKHTCLVLEPFREPFWLVKTRFRGDTIPADILKVVLQEILHGLDYLHSDCKIIHTGESQPSQAQT